MTGTTSSPVSPTPTRVAAIADDLRTSILSGEVAPGDRLPSEADLTRRHSVSRTVVREAFAQLRSEGLVEARKGSGVYALDPSTAQQKPFAVIDTKRISSVIELFEIRSAFEIRAAALAAVRRSGQQIEGILRVQEDLTKAFKAGTSTREADFAFHYAIAEATQNRHFPEFLSLIRPGIVPRVELESGSGKPRTYVPNPDLAAEHERIIDAILNSDPNAAEAAMKSHLEGSLERYRSLLRST